MELRHQGWVLLLLFLQLWHCESGFIQSGRKNAAEEEVVQSSDLVHLEAAGVVATPYSTATGGGVVGWCYDASTPGAGGGAYFTPSHPLM